MKLLEFIKELSRFIDKYMVQPDPVDTEAVDKYWREVASAMLAWNLKHHKEKHYLIYQKWIMLAFETLEDLFNEKSR